VAGAIGGAAIVETIFSWGGIGQWAVAAMQTLDLAQVQGFVLLTATTSLVVYLLIDVVVAALDPRISYGRR
jgi:peptide/nickel transport system permease protein